MCIVLYVLIWLNRIFMLTLSLHTLLVVLQSLVTDSLKIGLHLSYLRSNASIEYRAYFRAQWSSNGTSLLLFLLKCVVNDSGIHDSLISQVLRFHVDALIACIFLFVFLPLQTLEIILAYDYAKWYKNEINWSINNYDFSKIN